MKLRFWQRPVSHCSIHKFIFIDLLEADCEGSRSTISYGFVNILSLSISMRFWMSTRNQDIERYVTATYRNDFGAARFVLESWWHRWPRGLLSFWAIWGQPAESIYAGWTVGIEGQIRPCDRPSLWWGREASFVAYFDHWNVIHLNRQPRDHQGVLGKRISWNLESGNLVHMSLPNVNYSRSRLVAIIAGNI